MKTTDEWIKDLNYHHFHKVPLARLSKDIEAIQADALSRAVDAVNLAWNLGDHESSIPASIKYIKGIIDRLNGRTPLKNSLEERIAFLEMENRELNLKLSERGIE